MHLPCRSGKADRDHAALARGLERRDHIRGTPGGGNCDQHIALAAEPAHLTLEYLVKTIVIADRGQYGCVRRQRDGRKRIPVETKAREKFRRYMLRIGSAAAITGN